MLNIIKCFYCQGPLSERGLSWSNLLSWDSLRQLSNRTESLLTPNHYFCEDCLSELNGCKEKLSATMKSCLRCQKPLDNHSSYQNAAYQLGEASKKHYIALEHCFLQEHKCFYNVTGDESDSSSLDGEAAWSLCYDCLRWIETDIHKLELTANFEDELSLLLHRSAMANEAWVKEALIRYKYKQDARWRYIFAFFICEEIIKLQQQQAFDFLIPIPLNPTRLSERHFDHILEIACLVVKQVDIPLVNYLQVNDKTSQKQSKQTRQERIQNLLQKFVKNNYENVDIVNKRIILIDDIYTTGSTLHAAAYCLRAAGAKQIVSVSLARSI